MMYATLFVDSPYLNNRIFNPDDTVLNRDDCLRAYRILRIKLGELGFELNTQDITAVEGSAFTIYNDVPECLPPGHSPDKSMVLLFESEVVKPQNWILKNHDNFRYIFTWNDDFLDGDKYHKLFFAQPNLMAPKETTPFSERKFLSLIASNKSSQHPNESYSERLNTIKWFERNHPADLDLYGMGWDLGIKPRASRLRRGIGRRIKMLSPKVFFPRGTYRGPVESKYKTFSRYRFAICYENAVELPGYITEKIFDCFISGVVPIYLGPPNIADYIPGNTYIDRRVFKTHKRLYNYLNELSEIEYERYIGNINSFLQSEEVKRFSCEYFGESIGKIAIRFAVQNDEMKG